jgi:hypothetical protein
MRLSICVITETPKGALYSKLGTKGKLMNEYRPFINLITRVVRLYLVIYLTMLAYSTDLLNDAKVCFSIDVNLSDEGGAALRSAGNSPSDMT